MPDLTGWRRERMPVIPTEVPFIRLSPDWACEVLSPSTERVDRKQKLVIYRRERVSHVWLVRPWLSTQYAARRLRAARMSTTVPKMRCSTAPSPRTGASSKSGEPGARPRAELRTRGHEPAPSGPFAGVSDRRPSRTACLSRPAPASREPGARGFRPLPPTLPRSKSRFALAAVALHPPAEEAIARRHPGATGASGGSAATIASAAAWSDAVPPRTRGHSRRTGASYALQRLHIPVLSAYGT